VAIRCDVFLVTTNTGSFTKIYQLLYLVKALMKSLGALVYHFATSKYMSNIYDKSAGNKSFLSTQNIVLINIAWAVISLLYFLLFSAKVPDAQNIEHRAQWYMIGKNIFENVAYLAAGLLCLRNWRSPQIVSGRNVWLFTAIGMLSYFLGNIIFDYTELVLGIEPSISLGDIFFVISYVCLGVGMVMAVISRRISLEAWQLLIILAIGAFGSALAWFISNLPQTAAKATEELMPTWMQTVEPFLTLFYIVSDVLLLMIATTLLLAFWGGRASLSWRMIAAAAFSLYIADMWFKYASRNPQYESGDILEVFWVFGGVLFSMGAALEHDASLTRQRRTSGRKRP
jgi:hypothetical protein